MILEVREVTKGGELGEILPDWKTLSYLDSATQVGQVSLEYVQDGIRYSRLRTNREYALLVDGAEAPNGRFRLSETDGNRVADGKSLIKWTGPTLLDRLSEAIVGPREHTEDDKDGKDGKKDHHKRGEAEAADEEAERSSAAGRRGGKKGGKKDDKGKKGDKKKPKPPKPPVFKDDSPGQVLRYLVQKAHGRGAISEIKLGFTSDSDSAGRPWSSKVTQTWEVGTSILEVVNWLYENEQVECRMVGRKLMAYDASTVDTERGTDALLAKGKNLLDGPVQGSSREMVTAVYAISDKGPHGWVADHDAIKSEGRIEGKYTASSKEWDRLKTLGDKHLKTFGKTQYQYTYGVVPGQGADPYVDYQVGDWVNVLDGEAVTRRRVREIGINVDDTGSTKIALVVNDVVVEKALSNAVAVARARGRTGSTGTIGSVTPQDGSDGYAPTKPSSPIVTTKAGSVRIAYDGYDFEGEDPEFDQVGVLVHVSAESDDFEPSDDTLIDTIQVSGGTVLTVGDFEFVHGLEVVPDDLYDVQAYVKFVAVDAGGDYSDPSDAVPINVARTAASDVDPDILVGEPPVESPLPVAMSGPGAIVLAWDAVPGIDYDVHMVADDGAGNPALSSPDETTLHPDGVGVKPAAWIRDTVDRSTLALDATYWFALVARNGAGSAPASPWVPQQVGKLLPEYVQLSVDLLLANGLFAEAASIVDLHVSGDFEAQSLTAYGKAAFRDPNNELGPGASLVLQKGTTAPATPPKVIQDVPYIELITTASLSGGVWHGDSYYAVGGSTVQRFAGTTGVPVYISPKYELLHSVARLGASWYLLVMDDFGDWNVRRRNDDWSSTGASYQVPAGTLAMTTDGARLVFVSRTNGSMTWTRRFGQSGGIYDKVDATESVFGAITGAVVVDGVLYIASAQASDLTAFDVNTGVRIPSADFPAAEAGVSAVFHDGTRFRSFNNSSKRLYSYTNDTFSDGATKRWVSATWINSAGEETDQGSRASFVTKKRWRTQLTVAEVPGGSTGARVYMGRTTQIAADPGRTGMWLMGTAGSASRTITIPDPPVFAPPNVNPPALNNYTASAPALVRTLDSSGNTEYYFNALGDVRPRGLILPWVDYVPVWTGTGSSPTGGTVVGRYQRVGNTVHFRVTATLAAGVGSGVYRWTLPVAAATSGGTPVGHATMTSGGVGYNRSAVLFTPNQLQLQAEDGTRVQATVPVAFIAGDQFVIAGTYEAA